MGKSYVVRLRPTCPGCEEKFDPDCLVPVCLPCRVKALREDGLFPEDLDNCQHPVLAHVMHCGAWNDRDHDCDEKYCTYEGSKCQQWCGAVWNWTQVRPEGLRF